MLRITRRRLPSCVAQKTSKVRRTRWVGSGKWLLSGGNRLWSLLEGSQKRLKGRPIHGSNKIRDVGTIRKPGQWGLRHLRRRGERRNPEGRVRREGSRCTAALHGLGMEDNLRCNVGFHFRVFYPSQSITHVNEATDSPLKRTLSGPPLRSKICKGIFLEN